MQPFWPWKPGIICSTSQIHKDVFHIKISDRFNANLCITFYSRLNYFVEEIMIQKIISPSFCTSTGMFSTSKSETSSMYTFLWPFCPPPSPKGRSGTIVFVSVTCSFVRSSFRLFVHLTHCFPHSHSRIKPHRMLLFGTLVISIKTLRGIVCQLPWPIFDLVITYFLSLELVSWLSFLNQTMWELAFWHNDSSYQDLAGDCLSTSLTLIWLDYNLFSVIGIGFLTHSWTKPHRMLLFGTMIDPIKTFLGIVCQLPWPIFDLVVIDIWSYVMVKLPCEYNNTLEYHHSWCYPKKFSLDLTSIIYNLSDLLIIISH